MILVRFSQSRAHLEEPNEDVRGLTVKDAKGQEIGNVTDIFYDLETKSVRFLEVGSGGFLGLGERHFLVSAPDVKRFDSTIKLDMTREEIMRQPEGEMIHPMEAAPVRVKTGEMRRQMGTTEKPMGTTVKPMGTTEKTMGATVKPMGTTEKTMGTSERMMGTSERFGVMPEVGTAKERGQMGTESSKTLTGTAPTVKETMPTKKEPVHKEPTHMEKEPMHEAGMKGMTKEQMTSLVGKTAEHRVRASDGTVIAEKGDKITEKDVHNAEKHNALDMLMNSVGMKH